MPAKFSILTVAALPLLPLIPLLACGDDGGGGIHVVDAAKDAPGSGSGSGTQCSAQASYGTVTAFAAQGVTYYPATGSDATTELKWQGQLQGSAMDALEVLIFGGCGSGIGSACGGTAQSPAGTPDWPTTFGPKASLDANTAPDVLVLVLANLNVSMGKYQDLYLATSGTLNVTAAGNAGGSTFSGNGNAIGTEHIIISGGGIMAAPDGCTSNVTGFSFTGSATVGSAFGKPTMLYGASREEALVNYLRHRTQ